MFPAIPNLRDYILASVAPHSFTSLRHSCHPKLTDDDPLMSPDSYQGWTHDKSGCCAEIAYKFTFKNPEPLMRIELTTSSLPRKCSTTELQRLLKSLSQWAIGHWSRSLTDLLTLWLMTILSGRRGSNPRPTAWKAVALPTELLPQIHLSFSPGLCQL